MRVFFDTNVLIDVLAKREPFYTDSVRAWSLAESRRIEGLVSVISFTNTFYIVRRHTGRQVAHRGIVRLRDVFELVEADKRLVNQAIDADFSDFEDAIQFYSALGAGADCVVTRNKDHFPTDQIPILTPTEFLATHFAGEEWE